LLLYIGFRMRDQILGPSEVSRTQHLINETMKTIASSGHLVHGGAFADARAGFVVVQADTPAIVSTLLAPLQDHCYFDTHPLLSFEELQEVTDRLRFPKGH
jgi:hypothetical protein